MTMIGISLALTRPCACGSSAPLWDADFSATAAGALDSGVLTALALLLTRASAARAQTSASTVSAALSVDEAGIEYDGAVRGLLLEEARTNVLLDARALNTLTAASGGWAAGSGSSVSADTHAGPDGATMAETSAVTAGGYGTYAGFASYAAGTFVSGSLWRRSVSGTPMHQWSLGQTSVLTERSATSTTWERRTSTREGDGTGFYLGPQLNGGWGAAGEQSEASTVVLDMMQAEVGRFPTSFIHTSGGAATRAATRLRHTSPADLLDGGRLNLLLDLAPLGARGEYGGTKRIWTLNATNYVTITDAGVVAVTVDGSTFTCGTAIPAWARKAPSKLHIAAGGGSLNTVCRWRSGSTTTALGTSGAPQAAIVPGGGEVLDLLSNTTSDVFSALVARARAFPASYEPDLAAA